MALGSTQPLTEISTRSIPWGHRRSVPKADNLPPSYAFVTKSGNLNFLEPSEPVQACNWTALPLPFKGINFLICENTEEKLRGIIYICILTFTYRDWWKSRKYLLHSSSGSRLETGTPGVGNSVIRQQRDAMKWLRHLQFYDYCTTWSTSQQNEKLAVSRAVKNSLCFIETGRSYE